MDKDTQENKLANTPTVHKAVNTNKLLKKQQLIYITFAAISLTSLIYSILLHQQNINLKKQIQEFTSASDANKLNLNSNKNNSTTPTIGYIAKASEQYAIRDLQFKLPEGWWFNMSTNIYFGDSWTEIDPKIQDNSKPLFTLKAVSGKYQPTFSYENYLKNTVTESIYVSGIKGDLLIGIASPPSSTDVTCPECYLSGYKPNQKVAIALIKKDNNYYSFEGSVDNYENEYRLILSTFKFVE